MQNIVHSSNKTDGSNTFRRFTFACALFAVLHLIMLIQLRRARTRLIIIRVIYYTPRREDLEEDLENI